MMSKGKTTTLQCFPRAVLEKWREWRVQYTDHVAGLLEHVWCGETSHKQLAGFKELTGYVGELVKDDTLPPSLLLVLVEMHAFCLSRHPLQRAIARFLFCLPSLLQGLPELYKRKTAGYVHCTIDAALTGAWLPSHSHTLHYLEALLENFTIGELSLWRQLPLVVDYCVSVIELCSSNNMSTDPLFITVLKTFMAILHKTQSLVHSLLSGELVFYFSLDYPGSEVTWPAKLRGQSTETKVQWVTDLLEKAKKVCEDLLKTGVGVPHDLSLNAAMLYVVIILRTSTTSTSLHTLIADITTDWLRMTGSPLKAFPCLAVCHALLAKLPPSSLLVDAGGRPCLLSLFPIISHLFDSFTETSDRYIAARTLALWTTIARHCVGLVSEGCTVYEALLPSGSLISSVLQYVWALWEDPVDGIRHQCKLMFENVIGICQQLQPAGSSSPSPFLLSVTDSLLSLTSPTRGKYQLLSTLSHHLPVTTLLLTAPTLPTELLTAMGHQALACHAGELWSRLVKLHWDNATKATWSQTWLETMVHFMVSASSASRQHAIQHCLPCLFECCPDSMELIRASLGKLTTASVDSVLTVELACLHCAKSHLTGFSWDQSHEAAFTAATHHRDKQIQLSALGVLCESVRSTEPPPASSLPLLLTFLSLNGSTQSPNFRYPIITAIKKLLLRIRDSSYALRKLHSKRRGPDPHSNITAYQAFLQRLMCQQFACLHPYSSYQRRHTALSILQLLSSIFPCPPSQTPSQGQNLSPADHLKVPSTIVDKSTSKDYVISPVFEFPSAVSVEQARRLVHSLRDSYDANRELVLELLSCLHQHTLGLEGANFLERLTVSFHDFMCSPKAVDCTTASYLLRLLIRTKCSEFNQLLYNLHLGSELPLQTTCDCSKSVSGKSAHWVTATLLLCLLRGQLERARRDLLTASVRSPLYGVMQSIRATLEEAKAKFYDVELCKATIAEVVELCREVATLASPVVCNSSPEGFLPGTQGLPDGGSLDHSPVKGAGAQSLLLCCWHAMKETSLLMGLVVEWAPIGDCPSSLLTHSQVESIADIFIHQLTEARHRGAFEMAYSGFQKLCQSLWGSPCVKWQEMPRMWVKELLESLQSKSMSRLLSITRRSAGLPFFLQAILTSEPSHSGRPCLKDVMRTLLSVARACLQPSGTTASDTPPVISSTAGPTTSSVTSSEVQSHTASVHALNILRALYRDSRLGDHIVPFIPEGVEIAVHGFSASLWPVRNSSTLLFSALVLRIFGAKRVQDEHSIENKMTAREFFTRFPTLHGFLKQQLQTAAKELQSSNGSVQSLQMSLFPVLLILSRLYPTTLDEPSSPASLHAFLPLLLQCSSCAVWKTRVLISRALVPLITPHNVEEVLHGLLGLLTADRQNSLHTAVLTLQRLLQERGDLLQCYDSNGAWLSSWLLASLLSKQALGTNCNCCSVTRCSYLDLVRSLLADHTVLQKMGEFAMTIIPLLQDAQQTISNSSNGAEGEIASLHNVLVSCANLLFTFASQSLEVAPCGMLQAPELCTKCLQHSAPALRYCALQHIQLHPHLLSEERGGIMHSLLVQIFSTETDEDSLALLCDILAKIGDIPHLTEVCAVSLKRAALPHLRLELRCSLLLLLSSLLEESYNSEMAEKWLSLVEPFILPTAPVELRQAVAAGLGRLWRILLQENSGHLVEAYSVLVVTLLQDGAEEVRDNMAASVGAIFSSLSQYIGNFASDRLIQCPSCSSALQSYLISLPIILGHVPQKTLEFLLRIVDLPSSHADKPAPVGSGNLLFEEDPLNNYMEEITVLRAACSAMETLIANHCKSLNVLSLAQQVKSVGSSLLAKLDSNISPWTEQHWFHDLCKVALVREALVNGVHRSGSDYGIKAIELLNDFVHIKSKILIF